MLSHNLIYFLNNQTQVFAYLLVERLGLVELAVAEHDIALAEVLLRGRTRDEESREERRCEPGLHRARFLGPNRRAGQAHCPPTVSSNSA